MQTISRQEARDLIKREKDLKIIETLDHGHYAEFHLPGAERIRRVVPDKSAPVLLYCLEAECRSSSRAARQMDDMGYANVYDYEAGKVDWKAAGLPVAGAMGQTSGSAGSDD